MAICMAWHITYLFFGGRWCCCCLCVLFMHDMQHTCAASFFFVVITFACYGPVVLPMRVGLHCLVAYVWYISTVVRFVTYLFSPCLPLPALCLFLWFLALPAYNILVCRRPVALLLFMCGLFCCLFCLL